MYGLRKDVDLSFLIGREIIQVAIGVSQVQFHFDEEVSIGVEGPFKYFDGRQDWIAEEGAGYAQTAARTVTLLTSKIESFKAQADGTLSLAFSNRHRLTIFDSSKEFESYTITRPGKTIVV